MAGIFGISLSEASSNADDSPGFRILHHRIDSDILNWRGLKVYSSTGTTLHDTGVPKGTKVLCATRQINLGSTKHERQPVLKEIKMKMKRELKVNPKITVPPVKQCKNRERKNVQHSVIVHEGSPG